MNRPQDVTLHKKTSVELFSEQVSIQLGEESLDPIRFESFSLCLECDNAQWHVLMQNIDALKENINFINANAFRFVL